MDVNTPPTALDMDTLIAKFVALRDKVDEVKKRHTEELKPFNVAIGWLEAKLLDALQASNVKSMRSASGTVFQSSRVTARVVDWPATLDFIRQRDAWDLLEARVSKKSVEAIVEETQAPVPGVEMTREITLNVRRPT